MVEEKSPKPEAEVAEVESPSPNPNAGESGTPAASIENAPSSDEPQASDFPSANAPDPNAVNQEANPNAASDKPTQVGERGDTTSQTDAKKPAAKADGEKAAAKPAREKPPAKAAGEKPAAGAKAKKEKPPAPEDKPFNEFIEQEYLPALKSAFAEQGVNNVDLAFVKDKIQIPGLSQNGDCWQVRGSWQQGMRQFNVYFPDEDISKQKAFSWSTNGAQPSTLESFMIDERKVTLDLLVFYTIQRLNAQKWLTRN